MSNNVKAGKVAEDGVLSVFIITYQERPIKDQEKEGITNALKKIDGFEKIAINTSANTFFITTIKKRGSPQYPEIKAVLAELGFRIMKSEEELKLEKL